MKRYYSNPLFVLGSVILVLFGWKIAYNAYDNDLWWLLATGREIVENGIPYINPWTMHEGLSIVVQQWLSALIIYLIYSVFGMLGIKLFVFTQIVSLFILLFLLFSVSSDHRICPIISLITIIILFISISEYTTSRPHLWSMISYVLLLILLEKYRRIPSIKLLIPIPFIVCLHSNLHISMAPFDIFLIFLYCLPTFNLKLCKIHYHYSEYPRLPLLIIAVISTSAMILNPYGLDGALYLVKSYNVADYAGYISEMNPTVLWVNYNISLIFSIVLGLIIIGINGIKRLNLPITVLFLACFFLSLQHIRNIWLLPLFSVPLLADGLSNIHIDISKIKILSNKILKACIYIFCLLIFIGYISPDLHAVPLVNSSDDDANVPTHAVEYLNSYSEDNDIDIKTLKVYNSFDIGGFLEWNGLKVFMDQRPELWEPAITKTNEHYYFEFVDMALGFTEPEILVDKYDFDFLIAYDNTASMNTYLHNCNRYHIVVHGNGYNLWQKNEL